MRILLWHVHGAWTTAFVHGPHEYVVPVVPGRGPDGLGRAQTYTWPASVRELSPAQLRDQPFDVLLLQRPHEERLAARWLGYLPPSVYVEHNTPQGRIAEMRHPLADREDLTLVHVTHFNDLFWDAGATPTRVIEHGIVDPGMRYSGALPRAAVVINEAERRGRVTGTDLLERLRRSAPLDVFGIGGFDLAQQELHTVMARRRVYVHPIRWTSLGLSLLEAMHLGMPVVALGTTAVAEAVPADAGVVATDLRVLEHALRRMMADPDEARARGLAGRAAALERFGLARFLADWDALLADVGAVRETVR